ncbi:uncharacterized protein [Euwallacea fornicatus]|uniref:uncharacterized protein isoform X2 n=1 Tax=Euwallacea fornicatus TaxID=995702 RepID=UPI00338EDE80
MSLNHKGIRKRFKELKLKHEKRHMEFKNGAKKCNPLYWEHLSSLKTIGTYRKTRSVPQAEKVQSVADRISKLALNAPGDCHLLIKQVPAGCASSDNYQPMMSVFMALLQLLLRKELFEDICHTFSRHRCQCRTVQANGGLKNELIVKRYMDNFDDTKHNTAEPIFGELKNTSSIFKV